MTSNTTSTESNTHQPEQLYTEGEGFRPDCPVWENIEHILLTHDLRPEQDKHNFPNETAVYGNIIDRVGNPEHRHDGMVKCTFTISLYGEIDVKDFHSNQGFLMGLSNGVELELRAFAWDNQWKFDVFFNPVEFTE